MKQVPYKGDENFVELTGVIKNLPDYVKYVMLPHPRPLITFDLVSYRKKKDLEDEFEFDENRIILFDDEQFHQDFQNGDRVRIRGELQSRNFTRDNHEVDDLVKMAVKNYIDIMGEIPGIKPPKPKIRQPIDWKKILQLGLLPSIPDDSMFLGDNSKEKSKERQYVYQIDSNGDIFKSTEHVTYEVVVRKYEKLEDELEPLIGDKNKVVLEGLITRNPFFDMLGNENKVAFSSINVRTKSRFFDDRAFYNNVISWAKIAEEVFANIKEGDYVKVIGRLQSRTYNKEVTKRWTTIHGNKKKKKMELELLTREVSASKIMKCFQKK